MHPNLAQNTVVYHRLMLRRGFLAGLVPAGFLRAMARPQLKITGLEVFVVKVNARGNWVFVRLRTDKGLTGLGEASHGLGTDESMRKALTECFEFAGGQSPFDVEAYRGRAWQFARKGGRMAATAFSAIEQAMWDLTGKALGVPVYDLLGGRLREDLDVYANINRATNDVRTPEAFAANARLALEAGFRALKAAPFDGFPSLKAPEPEIRKAADLGIACLEAIRRAAGPGVKLLVDCHSRFSPELAIEVARRLEPVSLYWYEEPVAPARLEETAAISKAIRQPVSGGEALFATEGFRPLIDSRAFAFVMPDVKHCGGILEGRRIAARAQAANVAISPHNPSGPVATAASVQLCAGMPNFAILEHAWGEASWSKDLVVPPEEFPGGRLRVPTAPGLGIELNLRTVAAHA